MLPGKGGIMAVFICKMCGASLRVPDGTLECDCEYCGTHQTVTLDPYDSYNRELKAFLQRGKFALEDHQWNAAQRYFEKVLDLNPNCAEAHWGKFLAQNKLTVHEIRQGAIFENDEYYDSEWFDVNFKNESHVEEMAQKYSVQNFLMPEAIRNEYQCKQYYISKIKVYEKQLSRMKNKLESDSSLIRARTFADEWLRTEIEQCLQLVLYKLEGRVNEENRSIEKTLEKKKQEYLQFENETDKKIIQMSLSARQERESVYQNCIKHGRQRLTTKEWRKIQKDLLRLGNYKDAEKMYREIEKSINKKEASIRRNEAIDLYIQKNWKKALLIIVVVWLLVAKWIIPSQKYNAAVSLKERGFYAEAAVKFKELGSFKDSKQQREDCEITVSENNYNQALYLMGEGNYERAVSIFTRLKKYKDSPDKIVECQNLMLERDYNNAVSLMEDEQFTEAIAAFESLDDYKDSKEKIIECQNEQQYLLAKKYADEGKYQEAIKIFLELGVYKDSVENLEKTSDALISRIILQNSDDQIAELRNMDKEVYKYLSGRISPEAWLDLLCKVSNESAAYLLSGMHVREILSILEKIGDPIASQIKSNFDWQTSFRLENSTLQPGAVITFGQYEQDNDFDNGKEPIEWLVLENDGESLLLISKNAVEIKPFQEKLDNKVGELKETWETCSLRKWLNEDFLEIAFNDQERPLIALSDVLAEPNPDGRDDPGNDTQDRMFLLSLSEAEKYFASDKERICYGSPYLEAYGNYAVRARNTCEWWLRTQGKYNSWAAAVLAGGTVSPTGEQIKPNLHVAVRPAFRIEL